MNLKIFVVATFGQEETNKNMDFPFFFNFDGNKALKSLASVFNT